MAKNTSGKASRVMAEAEALIGIRRLRSALACYEKAHEEDPTVPAIMYQLGALNYCYLGNGLEARRWFQTMLAGSVEAPTRLKANACENLMLLSLSYKEYEKYAGLLELLEPANPILSDHRSRVRQAQEQAQPWLVVLGSMATMHHNPHDPRGAERFAECAATWQLILSQRRELRVPRSEWRHALISYGAALLQSSASAGLALQKALGYDEPEEVIFLLEPAKPAVREYLAENGDDPDVRKLLDTIERAFDLTRYRRRPDGVPPSMPVRPQPGAGSRYLGCLVLLVGTALGAVAGHIWIIKVAPPWNAVVGGGLGLFVTTWILSRTPLGRR